MKIERTKAGKVIFYTALVLFFILHLYYITAPPNGKSSMINSHPIQNSPLNAEITIYNLLSQQRKKASVVVPRVNAC